MAANPAARDVWIVQLDKPRICVVLRRELDRLLAALRETTPTAASAPDRAEVAA